MNYIFIKDLYNDIKNKGWFEDQHNCIYIKLQLYDKIVHINQLKNYIGCKIFYERKIITIIG